MKQVMLQVPDSHFKFFMELINRLGFVKAEIIESTIEVNQEEMLSQVAEGFEQMREYKRGALNLQTAKELYDEL